MKNLRIYKIAILSVMMLSIGVTAHGQNNRLDGLKWDLIHADGRPVTSTAAYIQIEPGQTAFSGNTGCNQMSGPVSLRGSRISFGAMRMTKRACKLMAGNVAEATFVKALRDTVRFSRNGNVLSFYNRRGRTILKFRRSADPDDNGPAAASLADKKWFLESIGNRKTLVAIEDVFVVFDPAKGSAGGNPGCNVFGGSYTAAKQTIAITDVISTMRACEEGGKMQLEREFLDGLRNANRFEIRNNRLFLYRGSRLLLTLRGEPK